MALLRIMRGASGRLRAVLNVGTAPANIIAARRAICGRCPRRTVTRRCSLCNCPTDAKTKLVSQSCPERRW